MPTKLFEFSWSTNNVQEKELDTNQDFQIQIGWRVHKLLDHMVTTSCVLIRWKDVSNVRWVH